MKRLPLRALPLVIPVRVKSPPATPVSRLQLMLNKLEIAARLATTHWVPLPPGAPRFRPNPVRIWEMSAMVTPTGRTGTMVSSVRRFTMPIAWRGTLAQYAGRLHRLHDPKREVVIYDYVDRDVPVLARIAAKRAAGYSAIGYSIAQGPGLFDG